MWPTSGVLPVPESGPNERSSQPTEKRQMRSISRGLLWSAVVVSSCVVAFAQAPAAPQGGGRGPAAPRLVLSVTSPAWADGGEVPMHHAGRADNKSPAFAFH